MSYAILMQCLFAPQGPPLSPHGGGKKGLNEKRNRLAKEIVPVDEEQREEKEGKKPHPGSSTDGHRQSDRAELFTRSRGGERSRGKKPQPREFYGRPPAVRSSRALHPLRGRGKEQGEETPPGEFYGRPPAVRSSRALHPLKGGERRKGGENL